MELSIHDVAVSKVIENLSIENSTLKYKIHCLELELQTYKDKDKEEDEDVQAQD